MDMGIYFRPLHSGHLTTSTCAEMWEFVFIKNGRAWKGELNKSELETTASELEMDFSEYMETSTKVFSDSPPDGLQLLITEVENDFELSWKKVASAFVKFSLGSVTLKQCEGNEVDKVLNITTLEILELKNKLERSEQKSADLESENRRLAEQMEKLAQQKVEMESQLFAKFVLILNEKKSKIRSLQGSNSQKVSETESVSSTVPTTSKISSKAPRTSSRKRRTKLEFDGTSDEST